MSFRCSTRFCEETWFLPIVFAVQTPALSNTHTSPSSFLSYSRVLLGWVNYSKYQSYTSANANKSITHQAPYITLRHQWSSLYNIRIHLLHIESSTVTSQVRTVSLQTWLVSSMATSQARQRKPSTSDTKNHWSFLYLSKAKHLHFKAKRLHLH